MEEGNEQGSTVSRGRRGSAKGEQTRMRILDAAEELFSVRGYYGVSLRDITVHARVENALASYHFGTKDKLFVAVIERRAAEHRADMLAAFEQVIAEAAPGQPSNEALVRAYGRPPMEKIGRGKDWAAYIRLIVSLQNLDRRDRVSILTSPFYDDVIKYVIDIFLRANPGVPRRRVLMGLYFLHGAFIHILSQVRALERVMEEQDEPLQGADDVLDELAGFFAARMRATN
ncbi:TetR/AcrR family transcriptional regulator [Rhizorhabdus dicambivorans]|uniref:TetR/AcrR family transcriptional regulator n=2 Tax=Rhizorhabdus dicambivorans TaxID=1850238 RepID=A0A2A4FVK7_9SPHN|nr:TetR/AcrR family transcriptional regulator [Rhizorhabdus dicambivorans]PCE41724.1 TetR/AcrR family transcriptional regulator [Rhizorhabdus dicambivorans]